MDNIRMVKIEDIDNMFDLSSYAFQYVLSDEDRSRQRRNLKLEQHWGYYEQDQLAAKIRLIPYQYALGGQSFAMGGIASVCTWPQFRRKGMVGKLLTHGLQVMKEHGQSISVLHPFSFAFYRKYGWEINTEYRHYTIGVHQLPRIKNVGGRVERIAQPRIEWEKFSDIYTTYALQYNGMLMRDDEWWQHNVLADQKRNAVIYYDENDQAQGYMLYNVEKREMNIKEMIFLNEMARSGLWHFISNHDSMIEKVLLIAPPDDPLPFLLEEPRIVQEIKPYSMARIVDVAAFFAQYPFPAANHTKQLTIAVTDEQAPWNNGRFKLEIDTEGKAKVSHVEVNDDEAKTNASDIEVDDTGATSNLRTDFELTSYDHSVIACDIQSLSAIMTGYQRPNEMLKLGRISGDEAMIAAWDAALPRQAVYLLDFF